ncbi:MAG: hypothetical protein ACR2KK_13840 [Acidimicrobiales bacterium]
MRKAGPDETPLKMPDADLAETLVCGLDQFNRVLATLMDDGPRPRQAHEAVDGLANALGVDIPAA